MYRYLWLVNGTYSQISSYSSAWICAYICMSAPFGRVVDRHIKLFRYRTHPVVASGDKLKEPLLHLVVNQVNLPTKMPKEEGKKAELKLERSLIPKAMKSQKKLLSQTILPHMPVLRV